MAWVFGVQMQLARYLEMAPKPRDHLVMSGSGDYPLRLGWKFEISSMTSLLSSFSVGFSEHKQRKKEKAKSETESKESSPVLRWRFQI